MSCDGLSLPESVVVNDYKYELSDIFQDEPLAKSSAERKNKQVQYDCLSLSNI